MPNKGKQRTFAVEAPSLPSRTPKNTNCLQGMQCPNEDCRSLGPYRISVTGIAEVHDDGSEHTSGLDWGSQDYCQCVLCSFEGSVFDFEEKK